MRARLVLFAGALIALASSLLAAEPSLNERYRDDAGRLIGAALVSDHAYERLAILCDRFGHRLSGSQRLEAAIDWCISEMKRDGLENVRAEPVMVPAWSRGEESARIVEPQEHELTMLGLGGSVGTPEGGLRAEVVVVSSFDELEALGAARVRGRIALFDVPFTTYGETVRYRSAGATAASRLGAVASLVRSVGPRSLDTPHTGGMSYADDVEKIPTAAITIEGATTLRRLFERGDRPVVELQMSARWLPDAPSANVIAELVGSELPEEVVVVGGHIDSWDVGQGAQDDGVGCILAWEAVRLIKVLGLRPRRTIRVVLWTNEENGTRGAKAHAEEHEAELDGYVAVIESDSGNGFAAGFSLEMPEGTSEELTGRALAILRDIGELTEPLGSGRMQTGGSGADASYCVRKGVPGLGLNHDTSDYFAIHHTPADTFDKIIRKDLDTNLATLAVMVHVLADMPGRLLEPASPGTPAAPADRASFSKR